MFETEKVTGADSWVIYIEIELAAVRVGRAGGALALGCKGEVE